MTPAQRRKRLSNFGKKKRPFGRIILGAIILLIAVLFFTLNPKFFKGDSKLSLVINQEDGDILVSTFDSQAGEITNIKIPGDTQLRVSRQLGTWRAKSIWQLGQNEKAGGELLRESVVKNFLFPAVVWADTQAVGFTRGEPASLIKAVFFPYKTNLSLGDKFKLAVFSLRIKSFKRTDIDLTKYSFLKRTKLTDGQDGFIVSGSAPQEILVIFSQTLMGPSTRVRIVDASGANLVAVEVGEVIEVMGAKVASVEKGDVSDFDCRVWGKDKDFVTKVSLVFGCKKTSQDGGNFDLNLEIGEKFAKRY